MKPTIAALAVCLAGGAAVSDENAVSTALGWAGPEGHRERVPAVEFDFEGILQRDEGDGSGLMEEAPLVPLADILSPRELENALRVARAILRRASPGGGDVPVPGPEPRGGTCDFEAGVATGAGRQNSGSETGEKEKLAGPRDSATQD